MQIAIVLYPGFTALDAIGPYELLRSLPESEVRFVHHDVGPVTADSNVLTIMTTHSLEETPTPDIILVPGSGTHTLIAAQDEVLRAWLNKVHLTTKRTLSVCTGSVILAAAGLLKGKPATTHWLAQDYLEQFGAIARRNDRVVKTGKTVTAAGVSAGIDLALTVIDDLCGRDYAELVQLQVEYDPQPHLNSGHPTKASEIVVDKAKQRMLGRAES